MSQVILAEYGRAKTINFDLYEVDGVDFRTDAADAGADCSIMKDEGAESTCTNDFVDEGQSYSLVLTATEIQAARATILIVDSAAKVWLDKHIYIETYGHLSSAHPFMTPYWTNGAVNDGSASATAWTFDGFTEATADHVIGSELTFTSGVNAGQCRPVVDSTSTVITVFPGFIAAPADNDEFVLRALPRLRPVDAVAISGDVTAADNLELQYDTTGLTGGTFPATQDQVGAISTSGGAALNFAAADDNVDGALNSVTFVGVETSGTFGSTEAEDGTNHVIDDTTNVIDIVYQFNIGGGRTGTEVAWKGFLAGNGDSVNIQVFDFVGSDWETRAVITGKNQAVNETVAFALLAKHTGTGANIGIVFLRFITATATNPTLETDELIVEAVNIGQTIGYQTGAVWIDTVNGTAGTEDFVNGTADNPVKSIADANTLATSLKLNRFIVSPGSSITFVAAQESQTFLGLNWTLALGGQSISDSHISGADVSGTGTALIEVHFDHCEMGDCTLGACHIDASDLEGDITLSAATNYFILGCHHTASGVPTIDFGSGVGNTTVHIHDYHGAIQISNMGQGSSTDVLHFSSPDGKLTLNASNIAGTVNLNGTFDLVNSGSGQTINKDGAIVSTVGALGDAAAAGDPTSTDTLASYIKQFINIMVGTAGIVTWPTSAAPGDGVSIAEALRATYDDTNELQGDDVPGLIAALNDLAASDILTTALTESYSADGSAPTLTQLLMLVLQHLTEFAISGTTWTTKKLDGSATAATFTLDDDTNPTSITRFS